MILTSSHEVIGPRYRHTSHSEVIDLILCYVKRIFLPFWEKFLEEFIRKSCPA